MPLEPRVTSENSYSVRKRIAMMLISTMSHCQSEQHNVNFEDGKQSSTTAVWVTISVSVR